MTFWDKLQFLYVLYWRLESVLDPGTTSTQYRYADRLRSAVDENSRWLDFGCGHSILPDWVSEQQHTLVEHARRAVGLDYDWGSVRKHEQITRLVSGDCAMLPFRDSVFDRISANMVVEHLVEPGRTLQEIHRVLRPGGFFVFHTPNARFYMTKLVAHVPQWLKNKIVRLVESRPETDVYPTHYRMNCFRDIHRLARENSFRVVACDSLNTSSASNIFLGPFVLIELLIRRILRHERFKEFRSNFIVILEKA